MEGGNNRFIVTDKHLQDLEDYASDNGSGASSAVIPYYANQNENGKKSIVPYDGGSAGGSVTYSNYSYGDGTSIVPYSVANSSVNPAEYNNYSLSNVDIEGAEEAQMPTEEIVPFENRKKETQPSRKRSHKPRKPMQKCFPQIILALFTLFFVAVIGLGVALYVFNDLEDSKVQEGVDNDIESTKPPVVTITDPPVELPVDTTTTYPTAGTPEPTAKPTSAPTMPPVTGNTTDSTMESNENATSTSTSVPVTPGPTKSPHEDNNEDNKIPLATFLTTEFGVDFTDPYSPAYLAHQWISMQDIDGLSNDQLAQRFALVALDYSLLRNFDSMQVSNWVSSESHECSWEGVTCASNIVTGVRLHSMDLPGMIPSEIGILKNLTSLDLAENQLFGTIPEALYKLTQLNEIYLYKNKLTGTISPSIGNLTALAKLHLSHNNLSGSIPETMRSDPDIKPYRYINFYSNQLTGTIPSFLRWRRLFFLDLGRNQLIGTIPEDMERFVGLRHLHLDHNQFKGSLPETFPEIGNGQLETISINDNQFTGQIPGKFEFIDKLVEFDAQNNTFNKKIDNSICSMAVLDSGAMVELKVDCNICQCQTMFCDHCL